MQCVHAAFGAGPRDAPTALLQMAIGAGGSDGEQLRDGTGEDAPINLGTLHTGADAGLTSNTNSAGSSYSGSA